MTRRAAVRSWAFRLARCVAIAVGVWYAFLVVLAMGFADRFIFFPSRHPDGYWATEHNFIPLEEVTFPASDGVKLVSWYARPPNPRGTVLFFHGNAGNITHRRVILEELGQLGVETLGVDYRGYGKSEGTPDEKGLYADAEGAYDYLVKARGVDPSRIVLYGKSLGGAPALYLAERKACAGLLLQSTFTCVPDVARNSIPFFPSHWFLSTRCDNLARIRAQRGPLMILHSRDDEIIPFSHGRALYEAASEPKELVEFAGVGHNELIEARRGEWKKAIREFLDRVLPK